MTQPLAGLVVVVTRPARQAERFIGMLMERGAAAVAFPTVAIEPVPLDDQRPRGARRAADRLGHLYERERRRAGARADRPACASRNRGDRPSHGARGRSGRDSRRRHSGGRRGFRGLAGAPGVRGALGPAYRRIQGRRRTRRAPRRARAPRCSGHRRRGLPPPAGRSGCRGRWRNWPAPAPPHRPSSQSRASRSSESLLQLAPESRAPHLQDATLLVPGERVAAAARRHGWRGPIVVRAKCRGRSDARCAHRAAGSRRPARACVIRFARNSPARTRESDVGRNRIPLWRNECPARRRRRHEPDAGCLRRRGAAACDLRSLASRPVRRSHRPGSRPGRPGSRHPGPARRTARDTDGPARDLARMRCAPNCAGCASCLRRWANSAAASRSFAPEPSRLSVPGFAPRRCTCSTSARGA